MIRDTAFETFIKAYQNMVFSTAVRLLGNPVDAKDIAQEVFLKAHARFNQLADNPSAGGWLKKVTTNLCLNHLTRYRARWRFFSEMVAEDSHLSYEESLAAENRFQQEEELQHRRHYLEKALLRLPSNQRVPLVLYHFEEMPYEAIAQKLGVSLSKIKTDIHRGRKSLKQWLEPGLSQECKQPATGNKPENSPVTECVFLPWALGSEAY
jgi:RNA polymerase sigma-70 factor (ECF subfamily)